MVIAFGKVRIEVVLFGGIVRFMHQDVRGVSDLPQEIFGRSLPVSELKIFHK
jgi:hypothetical protein